MIRYYFYFWFKINMITKAHFLFILIQLIEITGDRKEKLMNTIRDSYIITFNGNHAILNKNKNTTKITEEEKNVEKYLIDNNIYHQGIEGNEIFNELLKENYVTVANLMKITTTELDAVRTITNLKTKLGKNSLVDNELRSKSVAIIEYWNDFIHQLHHEEEIGRALHENPTKITT